jgi:hypothetical protein
MTIFDNKKPGVSFIRFFITMGLSWAVIIFGLTNL